MLKDYENLAMGKWLSYDTLKYFGNLTFHQLASPFFNFTMLESMKTMQELYTEYCINYLVCNMSWGEKFVDAPLKVYIRYCVARNADKTKECLEFYIKNQVQLFSLKFKDRWMILGQMLSRAVDQNDIVQFHPIE